MRPSRKHHELLAVMQSISPFLVIPNEDNRHHARRACKLLDCPEISSVFSPTFHAKVNNLRLGVECFMTVWAFHWESLCNPAVIKWATDTTLKHSHPAACQN